MKTRHKLAGVMGATTALALIPAAQAAYAHETAPSTAAATTVARAGTPWFSGLSSFPLDRLDAWATWLQKTSAAVPDDTVLTGRARLLAKSQLSAALSTSVRLNTLTGLTTEQQAKVHVITARLAAAAASLRALLDNAAPAPTPVTVAPTTTSARVVRTSSATAPRHFCDHDTRTFTRDGFRDHWRDWSRDGSRDGFRTSFRR